VTAMRPSPKMREILEFLNSSDDAVISSHRVGGNASIVTCGTITKKGQHTPSVKSPPKRIKRSTFIALQERGWLEFVRRRDTGGIAAYKDKPAVPFCELDYRITDSGREALGS